MSQQDKVRELFATTLGIPMGEVTDDLSYNGRAEWDSISHMMLIAALDKEFDIMLDTEDVLDLSSVSKAFEILKKNDVDC